MCLRVKVWTIYVGRRGKLKKRNTSCWSYSLLRYYVENKDNFRLNINIMLQMYSNVTKTRWAHSRNKIYTWGISANLGWCSGQIADPGNVCRPCRRGSREPTTDTLGLFSILLMVLHLQTSPLVEKWGWGLRFCLPFLKNICQVRNDWRAAGKKCFYVIPKAQHQSPFRREERVTGILSTSPSEGNCHSSYQNCHSSYRSAQLLSHRDLQSTARSKGTQNERHWNLLGFSVPLLIWGAHDGVFLIRKFKKTSYGLCG